MTRWLCSLVVIAALAPFAHAAETTSGHLVIIGGGLLPDNSAVYERLITHAGGSEQARFGILPTASNGTGGAERFARQLQRRGVAKPQIQIIDLTAENAQRQSSNPAIVKQIKSCTGLFFTGGNQLRITNALIQPDGTETDALKAIRDVLRQGGVIAGSSAGAAAQADTMIAASGLPDDSLDAGMDALDFGVTAEPYRRGVLVSRGLGFFRGGLIDQHFSQFRGRLGRLARVAIEKDIRFGFGIDENTAMDVAPDGTIEVIGAGHVTIVDAAGAKCKDGPLGCRMDDVRLFCLATGDRFDPKSGVATVHQDKKLIVQSDADFNGNFPIPDIAGPQAVLRALLQGLGNNTSHTQIGYMLKFNQHHCHGYRFTFSETQETCSYEGDVDEVVSCSVVGARLKLEPVVLPLKRESTPLAIDLPPGPAGRQIEALLYRGILLNDAEHRCRPSDPMLRADLANAIAQTTYLRLPRKNPPQITDAPPTSPGAEEIALVVGEGLMETDSQGNFRGTESMTLEEAVTTLVKLKNKCDGKPPADDALASAAIRDDLLTAAGEHFRPNSSLTRQQAATAVYRIIGFPW